ncbi:DUF881 domain-containing protein [Georgenia sp. AZ-5]|uniref:DUF881 domain-containing protein n=1 Tax=Georgenia sp. AZ-5 TaxID=3367526 RepID=UPI0037546E8C
MATAPHDAAAKGYGTRPDDARTTPPDDAARRPAGTPPVAEGSDSAPTTPTPATPRRAVPTKSMATAVVALLAGLLFATNAQVFAGTEDRHPENLQGLARAEAGRLEDLEAENAELREEVRRYVDTEGTGAELAPQADLAEQAAGHSPMTGPAVQVRLWDAPQQADGLAATLPPDALVVHQQDIEAVMNALWAGGAEAMTVQGHRVVSTTGVRCVGNVLHIAGRTYSPPYDIQAIGDPGALRDALEASPGVQTYLDYVDAVGLGWSLSTLQRVEMPAYAGSLTLDHAEVIEDGRA